MTSDVNLPDIPRDAAWMAGYLLKATAKLRYLLTILRSVVSVQGRKLLLFARFRTGQFFAESFLTLIGFDVRDLLASMSMVELASMITAFNDRPSNLEVLIVTFATCSVGVNVQKACADMDILEPAVNLGIMEWAIMLGTSSTDR
jgi:hypothetical protein